MEALNLVEVVLQQGTEEDNGSTPSHNTCKSSPIKGLNESVTITVTRTPSRPATIEKQSGKPANFALLTSPVRNGRNSDAIRITPREEMVCNGCERVFKYKAAFLRHEAQCGLPVALRIERAALLEAKKAEKAAELERRKMEERQEKTQKPVSEFRCPTCLKQFSDNDSFKSHNFEACAAERSTYIFTCGVCKARFKYKNHMRRHEDSHNNVRRYTCDVCTTAFLRPDHLKRHMMRMHGIVQLPSPSIPEMSLMKASPGHQAVLSSDEQSTQITIKNVPMQCPMCKKILSRRDHLLRHMRNVHHVNYDSRKRGRTPHQFNESGEGPMDLDGSNSYPDDEDGSESQSMSSQEDLQIDESLGSMKRESESPSPKHYSGHQENSTSQGQFSKENTQLCSAAVQKVSRSFNQFEEDSPAGMEVNFRNRNGTGVKNLSNSAMSLEGGPVKTDAEEKSGQVANSDGNQNVLSNGHPTHSMAENWISW